MTLSSSSHAQAVAIGCRPQTVSIPAYAADTLGETLTLHAPAGWHERIRALAPACCYGTTYRRDVVELLGQMSFDVLAGYHTLALSALEIAEALARL